MLDHLRREWETVYGAVPRDADLRGLLRVLRFAVVDLLDDGADQGRAVDLLEKAVHDASAAKAAWGVLTSRCHELAERNHWIRDDRLRQKLTAEGIPLSRIGAADTAAAHTARERASDLTALLHRAAFPIPYIPRDAESEVRGHLECKNPVVLVGSSMSGKTHIAVTVILELLGDRPLYMPVLHYSGIQRQWVATAVVVADQGSVLMQLAPQVAGEGARRVDEPRGRWRRAERGSLRRTVLLLRPRDGQGF